MPLYLVPLPKTVDGVEIPPWKTLGGRAFDPNNEGDVAYLRKMYDEENSKLPPLPKRSLLRSLFGLGREDPFTAEYRAGWTRPFEEVVAEWAHAEEPKLVQESDPGILESEPHLKQLDSFPDYPIDELSPMPMREDETGNDVIRSVMEDEEIGTLIDELIDADGLPPERMLKHAEKLGQVLAAYTAGDHEQDGRSLFFTAAAMDWLRFWGERGHGCGTQRYLLAAKDGVVHKVVIHTD